MKSSNKCRHCQQKKGKRNCPALSGTICTLCCGKHRQKEINCPADCAFTEGDAGYNIKKQLDHFGQTYLSFCRKLVYKHSQEVAQLLFMLDASALTYYVKSETQPKDEDITGGWEYILNRSGSGLVVPNEIVPAFADFLMNHTNRAVQEQINEKEEMKGPVREYLEFVKNYSTGQKDPYAFTSIHRGYLESITTDSEINEIVEEYSTAPKVKEEPEEDSIIEPA